MISISNRSWQKRKLPPGISQQDFQKLADKMQMPLSIIHLLAKRGITDVSSIDSFLHPSLMNLPAPSTMKDMEKAVGIIAEGLKRNTPIVIYGDYDADGITSTSLLLLFLKHIGGRVSYYIPDRFTEGYGLNQDALNMLAGKNPTSTDEKILITVDCGISSIQEVRTAKQLGFTVIITDHHTVPEELPEADAILNPQQPGCSFPFKQLAGVGVVFYLLMGLRTHLYNNSFWSDSSVPNLKSYLDIVALGTVGDLVRLHGINRIFVKTGLEVINSTERVGLISLQEKTTAKNNRGGDITAEDIAFRLVPRINAAGRMEHAGTAVELLTCDTGKAADAITDKLEANNNQRKIIQKELFNITSELAQSDENAERKSLVLAGTHWHAGVIGIVASQLCEKYEKPTLVLSIDERSMMAKGSGRSIQTVHLFDALGNCHELLEQFGGHANAAGFTIKVDKIRQFAHAFEKTIRDILKKESVQPSLEYDDAYHLHSVFDNSFIANYVKLSPFGIGNQEPVFVSYNVTFKSARVVGENHLKFTVTDNGKLIDGIGFGFGFLLPMILKDSVSIAYNIRCNTFRGGEKWEMNLIDVKMQKKDSKGGHPHKS